jgi:hypothetical protein
MILRGPAIAILAAIQGAPTLTRANAQEDPQAILNGLIQQQMQTYQASQENENMRLELERQELTDQLRYRRATDGQVMQELQLYCPSGNPPCPTVPPQSLLREAVRRGLITFANQPAQKGSHNGLIFGDGEGGGVADCQ